MNWTYEQLRAIYVLGIGYGTEGSTSPYHITVVANKKDPSFPLSEWECIQIDSIKRSKKHIDKKISKNKEIQWRQTQMFPRSHSPSGNAYK